MVGLGVGEIVGALSYGRIQDKIGMPAMILVNIFGAIVSFSVCISYILMYQHSFIFGFLMTFFWGVQDGGINTMINCILGF